MVTGPFINASAVLVGGVLGALFPANGCLNGSAPAMTSIFGPGVIGHRHFTGH
ncbi:hypothetical protein MJ560_23980 [Klebsiella pneumoniae]|nr:hypothetical protein MJ560_23980 [Klebsiella pneumoniae]